MGEKIAGRQIPKILLLNGSHDRETSASKTTAGPMSACDVVLALCDALNRRHAKVSVSCLLQAAGASSATSIAVHATCWFFGTRFQDMLLSAWNPCRLANHWTTGQMLMSLPCWFPKGVQLSSTQQP